MDKQQLKYKIGDLQDQLDTLMENEISEEMLRIVKYIKENDDANVLYALRGLVENVRDITLEYVKLKGG